MAGLSELLGKLDSDNQIRGRQFERICKWYLENDPRYKLKLKQIWLWNEWPGRWGPDAGIDLVAQTHENSQWAVQAKAYAPTHHITKADVDTFLSESSREVFSYRLLIGTTNFIGRTADRTLDAQEKPVGKILLSDLQKSEVEWPESPESLEGKPPERKETRPHQETAICDVCEGFTGSDRGQLIMASGTGKTLAALWIAEKLQSQRTLVLLPSLSLLGQTLREWAANASQPFHYIPVCSDDTVRGADRLISKASDLGLPAATDPNEVAAFLRQDGPLVVFSTYQSSPVIAEAFKRDNVPAFDLAVADEAHRCAGSVLSPFATILDAAAILTHKRLFMTATPRYFTDRVREEAKEIEYEIASMDEESEFGPVFHKLTYAEAIQQDLLSDYQVVIIGVDDPTYREYAEQGTFVTTDGENITDARILASQIAIGKAMRKYDLRRIISFHSRIKRAKQFSERLPHVVNWMPEEARPEGQIWSKHVSGLMPAGQRDVLLDHFRDLETGERGVLSNARCLGEGVDVPSLDGVAFIDPRSSQLDIIQAVGRAIRKAPDKRIGTVVLPVFIDPEQDPEAALNTSSFKSIWKVLKALRAHDEVLGEVLDKLRRQLGRHCRIEIGVPEKLMIDLPVTVDESFVHALRLKAIERSTASWEFHFGLLARFIDDEGHVRVPEKYVTPSGHKLGMWVQKQRQAYRRHTLSRERQQRLEGLGTWLWAHHSVRSGEGLRLLRKYFEQEGHIFVPADYVTEDGYCLGKWVLSQKEAYRKRKISKRRQSTLEKFPGWRWDVSNSQWYENYWSLHKYVERKGHVFVPLDSIDAHGHYLGHWVEQQRRAYRRGELPTVKQEILGKLPGWTWEYNESLWQMKFRHLREYTRREGHASVPADYLADDGEPLIAWVTNQRRIYWRGKLSERKKLLLENLGGWTWSTFKHWQKMLKRLRKYCDREGHIFVPAEYITDDNQELGKWVVRQRFAYLHGTISKRRKDALEKLPGWVWDNCEALWQEGFKHLSNYAKCHGHTLVPENYVTQDKCKLG